MSDDSKLREEPISEERVFGGNLINVFRMKVRLPDGRAADREVVRHNGAAAIVPVDDEGFVYLVRQHRVVVDTVTLEIPAGKLDSPEEDVRLCAVRELEEETGLRAEHMEFMTRALTTPGFCTERIGLFLATGLSRHESHPDADEFLNVVRMPLSEALELVDKGEINDMKSALGLLMAARRLGKQPPKV